MLNVNIYCIALLICHFENRISIINEINVPVIVKIIILALNRLQSQSKTNPFRNFVFLDLNNPKPIFF